MYKLNYSGYTCVLGTHNFLMSATYGMKFSNSEYDLLITFSNISGLIKPKILIIDGYTYAHMYIQLKNKKNKDKKWWELTPTQQTLKVGGETSAVSCGMGVLTPTNFILFILFSRLPTPKWEPEVGIFGETTPKMEVWESDLHFLGVVSPSPFIYCDRDDLV